MSSAAEERCICGHWKTTHIIDLDKAECVCAHAGCKCRSFFLWEVSFYGPDGKKYTTSDVAKFVRDNPDLFTDDERRIRFYRRIAHAATFGRKAKACTAETGLSSLTTGVANEWHGWTLAHFPKTYVEPKEFSGATAQSKAELGRDREAESTSKERRENPELRRDESA